jgi:transcription-repair coupling factor (superfamily II helicase)
MASQLISKALSADSQIKSALELISHNQSVELGIPSSALPFIAGLVAKESAGSLIICATDRMAEDVAAQLADFVDPDHIAFFPAWETLPHERLSPSGDTIGTRMAILRKLANPKETGELKYLVTSVRAVIQPMASDLGNIEPLVINEGQTCPPDEVIEKLSYLGYERVELVDRRGQFAVRGGIIDVFPPAQPHPLRLEFWGDDVDDIRMFSVADQRSLEIEINQLFATPCRELLITDSVKAKAKSFAKAHPDFAEVFEKVAEGIATEGLESFIPVLADSMETLFDVIPKTWVIQELEPERIATRAQELIDTSAEFLEASWSNTTAGNAIPVDLGKGFHHFVHLKSENQARTWISLSTLMGPDALIPELETAPQYRGQFESLVEQLANWWAGDFQVVISMAATGTAERLVNTLTEHAVAARQVDKADPITKRVDVVLGHQENGLIFKAGKLVFLTETDLFGNRSTTKATRSMPSRRKTTIDPLTLKSGDYIVHEHHGVGKYIEMSQRVVQGATREYLVIEYASSKRGQPGDRLYVPSDQLDLITRYVGGELPTLNRLGGGDWAATKSRARRAVRQIAGELIRLYAARMASRGHAFAPDSPWQRELEDAFEYVETPDQLSTINEVKADMERDIPMDRLVCGDVGYGKTEIAVRAAFKAVQDGKQVAVLVPTTLLVQQHMETFSRRYAQFPIKLAALSRFQTDGEVKKTFEAIKDGTVDVVIGTHRLFNPEVRFKDLGLVIVDEEQRFGVEHKEHLKALRTNVDMLTMSATPIPRTLEMAVTGLREMSTIQTPPEERHPVLTSVGPYDEKYIVAAIHRELIRDGQVFFVHNRVESINRVASRLGELIPEARIAVAHGQMNEHQLEQIIVDFWQKKYDVLVSTTIIESGLDIPNANTLIVDRADTFGLSQLHQLRGRVGRSRERGYAYFLYSPEKPLTETAHDRLATIAAHTDLGSGMAVAMKDLEIRGAGNLLGGEQSGHIADVGFDLYVRLVGEAIAEVKNGPQTDLDVVVKVELPVDAHLPHNYVPNERLRLEAYRRLADSHTDEQIHEVVAELTDRYGSMPEPVERLVDVARLRILMRRANVAEVIGAGKTVRLSPVELPESKSLRLARMYPGTIIKAASRTIIVPLPQEKAIGVKSESPNSKEILGWVSELISTVILD